MLNLPLNTKQVILETVFVTTITWLVVRERNQTGKKQPQKYMINLCQYKTQVLPPVAASHGIRS